MTQSAIGPSFSQGYVLCSPLGVLLGHSYRATEAEVIASVFENATHREEFWRQAQADGWSVQFVYARIFLPAYFVAQVLPKAELDDAA